MIVMSSSSRLLLAGPRLSVVPKHLFLLPFDADMGIETALFRQIEVFNSHGTLYKGFSLNHASSSVADIIP